MGVLDRIAERAEEAFVDWTGKTLVDAEPYERLQEDVEQYETFARDAEDLAFWVLQDPMGGTGREMRRETRVRLVEASRRAWSRDPIAGTEAEHYANFTLGRGINHPVCRDEDVQAIVDREWRSSYNQEALLSLDALRAISNELITGSNVFLVAFVGNGHVRVSFLPADDVAQVVTYPGNPARPLYYVAHVRDQRWDFANDRWETSVTPATTQTAYFAHWRNVEEDADDPAVKGYAPPASKLKDGGVYHVRLNRLLGQQFGVPRWNRTLRFMSSLNRIAEARVAMAQASASIIAKRVMKGGKSDVVKAAQSVLQQAGEIGVSRPTLPTPAGPASSRPPIRPGSFHMENEGDQLQAFNLRSGASEALQDIQIVRAQAVSPSILGQHWFGDQDAAGATTAATMELPALMALGAYQEIIEQILRWFTDLVIQEAVRNGELGGVLPDQEDEGTSLKEEARGFSRSRAKPLSGLCLYEQEDRAEASRRTGKDLTYTFEMPYPGRRNLPDLVSAFSTIMTTVETAGDNDVLLKTMLAFLFTHGLQREDASELAEAITERQLELIKQAQDQAAQQQQQQLDALQQQQQPPDAGTPARPSDGGGVGTGDGSPDTRNQNRPDDQRPVYGEKRKAAVKEGLDDLPENVRAEVEKILGDLDGSWSDFAASAASSAEGANGHGPS